MTVQTIRDGYLDTLQHIEQVFQKLQANLGHHGVFTFPDVHKLAEGLFLSAWTYWEGFLRSLVWEDLAARTSGVLRHEVREFRYANSHYRLAERVLNHPDHPEQFVEWADYSKVVSRANEFLGDGHRFVWPFPHHDDLTRLKRIRNAIAHRSDRAWNSFIKLVSEAPFNLTSQQRRGITPGRFLASHQWSGAHVIRTAVNTLRKAATSLVP